MLFTPSQESDFVKFLGDPDSPENGLPPPPPSPEEEWAGLEGAENLHHLTDSSFDAFVKKKDSVLVMFYAPCKITAPNRSFSAQLCLTLMSFWNWTGCGHCKSMKADYALAAKRMKDLKIDGALVTVDATAQTGLQNRFEIRGFPTLRYFRKGRNVAPYEKARKADALVDFMRNPPQSKDEL